MNPTRRYDDLPLGTVAMMLQEPIQPGDITHLNGNPDRRLQARVDSHGAHEGIAWLRFAYNRSSTAFV